MGGSCSEPIHVNVFYVLIMNHFGKHYVIGLGLRLVLGLEWTAGASALSVCSCHGRHSVGFNWEHRASYKDAEGCLSRSYETPIQIVGMLHIMKENALPWTMNMVNRFSEVAQITLHETQQKNSCYSCLFHHSPVNQSSHTLNCA